MSILGLVFVRRFDINSLDPQLFRRNPPGLAESAGYVRQLIKEPAGPCWGDLCSIELSNLYGRSKSKTE